MSTPVAAHQFPARLEFDDSLCPGEVRIALEEAFRSSGQTREEQWPSCWFEPQPGVYVHLQRRQPTRTSPGEIVMHVFETAELRGMLEVEREIQAAFSFEGELRSMTHNGWVLRPGEEQQEISPFMRLPLLKDSCRIGQPAALFGRTGLAGLASFEQN